MGDERAEESVEIEGVTRLGRGRGWLAVGVACFAYAGVLIARLGADHGRLLQEKFALFGPMMVFAVGALAFGIGWEKRVARGKPARLSASARGLALGETRLATREELVAATVTRVYRDGVLVRLQRLRGLGIELRLASMTDARALRRALGLASSVRERARIAAKTLVSAGRSSLIGLLTFLGSFAPLALAMLLASRRWPSVERDFDEVFRLASFMVAALFIRWIDRAFATVGADGIELRAFRCRRFIPIHEVLRADVIELTTGASQGSVLVRLALRGGGTYDVVLGGRALLGSNTPMLERAGALAERVNELIANRPAPDAAPFDVASLTRAARPMDAWLASLRAMTLGTDTFRDDVTGRVSALLDVVDDSAAHALTRAAAAIALSRSDDPRARPRVSAASASTASPRLRAVLEAVSKDDDARLRDALAALEVADADEARDDEAAASPRRRAP